MLGSLWGRRDCSWFHREHWVHWGCWVHCGGVETVHCGAGFTLDAISTGFTGDAGLTLGHCGGAGFNVGVLGSLGLGSLCGRRGCSLWEPGSLWELGWGLGSLWGLDSLEEAHMWCQPGPNCTY